MRDKRVIRIKVFNGSVLVHGPIEMVLCFLCYFFIHCFCTVFEE